MAECGNGATQLKNSEKLIISFLPQYEDRTLNYSGKSQNSS
jgi:hypothetical protein